MSTYSHGSRCPDLVRLCWGPKCRPRQVLSRRQRRYHSKRCRLDAKNTRRYATAMARAANVAAVQRHRERMRVVDPLRRYLADAATKIVRAYREIGKPVPRDAVMTILRELEQQFRAPDLVRQKVRDLIRVARHDARRLRRRSETG